MFLRLALAIIFIQKINSEEDNAMNEGPFFAEDMDANNATPGLFFAEGMGTETTAENRASSLYFAVSNEKVTTMDETVSQASALFFAESNDKMTTTDESHASALYFAESNDKVTNMDEIRASPLYFAEGKDTLTNTDEIHESALYFAKGNDAVATTDESHAATLYFAEPNDNNTDKSFLRTGSEIIDVEFLDEVKTTTANIDTTTAQNNILRMNPDTYDSQERLKYQKEFEIKWRDNEGLFIPFTDEVSTTDEPTTTSLDPNVVDANKLFRMTDKVTVKTTRQFQKVTGEQLDANELFAQYATYARKSFKAKTKVTASADYQVDVEQQHKKNNKNNVRRLTDIWNWDYWCQLQPKKGSCDKKSSRYYYDSQSDQCQKFTYSGCDGNKNNFRSSEDCLHHCKGAAFMTLKEAQSKNPCDLQPSSGLCLGLIPKFYYDVNARTCKSFKYGGCGGNLNRFNSLRDCRSSCDKKSL